MPGDEWQKRANLRLLLGYMYTQPGKKLLFMGGELGSGGNGTTTRASTGTCLDEPAHQALLRWVRDLNTLYRGERALHELDTDPAGFEWIDCNDAEQACSSGPVARGSSPQLAVVACNFTPIPRRNYRSRLRSGRWEEILNSDAPLYGGSGQGNLGGVVTAPVPWHGAPSRST